MNRNDLHISIVRTFVIVIALLMLLIGYAVASGETGGPSASGPDAPVDAASSGEEDEEDKAGPEAELDPAIKKIIEEFGAWEDDATVELVGSIEEKLIAAADDDKRTEGISFLLLDEDSINAFALADGHIFLFRGLVERAETEDQLASVMAHELTHVIEGHHKRGMDTVTIVQLLGILGAIVAEEQEPAIAGQMISSALVESYGRGAEVEADINGADLMIDAGFDPLGMVEFFTYMQSMERRRPQLMGNYFTIHPYADERIENLKEHLRGRGIEVPEELYRLHLALDLNCEEILDHYECSVYVGDNPAFTLAGDDEDALIDLGYNVIHALRDVFSKGLRDYEVHAREKDGVHYLEAKGANLVSVSTLDIKYIEGEAAYINKERLKKIKFILWQYYIERRI